MPTLPLLTISSEPESLPRQGSGSNPSTAVVEGIGREGGVVGRRDAAGNIGGTKLDRVRIGDLELLAWAIRPDPDVTVGRNRIRAAPLAPRGVRQRRR